MGGIVAAHFWCYHRSINTLDGERCPIAGGFAHLSPLHSERSWSQQRTQHHSRTSPLTIALANQKGGVGKTTSAVNIAVELSRRGARVLLVDVDPRETQPRRSASTSAVLDVTVYDLLVDAGRWTTLIVPEMSPDRSISSRQRLAGGRRGRPGRFRRRAPFDCGRPLQRQADYDLVVIDRPPSLGLLTVNALCAAQHVIVPIQCEYLALEGLGQLIGTIDLVKQQLNPELDLTGVLMTMYDARTRLSAQVVEEVRRYFPASHLRHRRAPLGPAGGGAELRAIDRRIRPASRGAAGLSRRCRRALRPARPRARLQPESPLFAGATEQFAAQTMS